MPEVNACFEEVLQLRLCHADVAVFQLGLIVRRVHLPA